MPPYHSNRDCIGFGKYGDQSVNQIIFDDPGYILWALSYINPDQKLEELASESRELIEIFNSKPFTRKCSQCNKKQAIECSVYGDSLVPDFRCKKCTLHSSVVKGKYTEIKTYHDAFSFAKDRKDRQRGDAKQLIQNLARAKGLSKRISKEEAQRFFACDAR